MKSQLVHRGKEYTVSIRLKNNAVELDLNILEGNEESNFADKKPCLYQSAG